MNQMERPAQSEPAGSAEQRLAASRRQLQSRLGEIGTAVQREVELAQAVKDGFVALLGVAGVLLAARRVSRSVAKKRRRKKKRKS